MLIMPKVQPKAVRIEKDVPMPIREHGRVKYPAIKLASLKMKNGHSVLFENYYHAAALQKYLKDRGFQAPMRVIRDSIGERQGWRVWALNHGGAK